MEEIKKKIEKIITENNVVLFMKGTSSMPQCGFSSRVAGVLNYLDIEFQDINVLYFVYQRNDRGNRLYDDEMRVKQRESSWDPDAHFEELFTAVVIKRQSRGITWRL